MAVDSQSSRLAMFHNLRAAEVVEKNAQFHTTTFLIRYADERVSLSHQVNFQALTDLAQLLTTPIQSKATADSAAAVSLEQRQTKFLLRVDLMQMETPKVVIADSIVCAENLREQILRSHPLSKFKCIQTKLYEVTDQPSGIMAYLPVNFGGAHSGQASLTIFHSLINLEFLPVLRPQP